MAVTLNSFSPNTKIQSAQVNTNFTNLSNQIRPTFVFTIVGTVATGTTLTPVLIVPIGLTIEKCFLYADTGPDGADLIVDINKNGSTIWSTQANRAKITDGSQSGNTSTFDTTALSEGDVLTLDVDQVGSGTPGAELTVQLKCS